MNKEDAIRTITTCAKEYHNQLENRNLLFIFGNEQNMDCFESAFLPRNYLHLTGVDLSSKSFTGSSDFYEKCLKGQLSPKDFRFMPNGTTEMKLQVLPQLMQIHKVAKMVGDFNFSKTLLITDKLVGNVTACMGFVRDDCYYVPNTALKEDIRNITQHPQRRILAVYKKPIEEPVYAELSYLAKGLTTDQLQLPKNVSEKIMLTSTNDPPKHKNEYHRERENTPFNDLLVKLSRDEQARKQSISKKATDHDPDR